MKLRNQFILTFVIITMVTAIVGGIITSYSIHNEFQNYTKNYQKSRLQQWQMIFTNYYTRFQAWDGVQQLIVSKTSPMGRKGYGPMHLAAISDNERVILKNSSGKIVADSNTNEIDNSYSVKLPAEVLTKDIIINGQKAGTVLLEAGAPSTFSSLENTFLSSVNNSVILSSLSVVILAIILAFLFSKRLSKPLKKLILAAETISAGNLEHNVPVESKNEVGQLASAFNKMAANLSRNEHLRRSLVADVAHELRTPLSILRANLESMLAGVIPANEEKIAVLYDETMRMTLLVRDLQELSLAEAKQLKLNREMVDILVLMKKITQFFQMEAETKTIKLVTDSSELLPNIYADPHRIEQIFANLISNAIRYSPSNEEIIIRISVNHESLKVEVTDNGPGIPADELPNIFERFYRGDKARSRVSGGAGLGLAIAKSFAEMHGGSISAKNNQKHGSTFTVTLPVK